MKKLLKKPTLKTILTEYIQLMDLRPNDVLLSKLNKKKMTYDTLHQKIKNFCDNRNVRMRGINTFRNTFSTLFIKNGYNIIYLLKKLLGHADIRMTERYINLLPCQIAADIKRIGKVNFNKLI